MGNDKSAESALQFNLATKTDIAAKSKVGHMMQSNDVIWNRSGHRQSGRCLLEGELGAVPERGAALRALRPPDISQRFHAL